MLTTENRIWLEVTSKQLDVTPESLINGVLRQIRTELGNMDDNNSLEGWLKQSINTKNELDLTLADAKETLRTTQETIKATQLYLNQIQRSERSESDVLG